MPRSYWIWRGCDMNAALDHLNWLIDHGVEYPDAYARTVSLFGCDGDELQVAYDKQWSAA